MKSLKDNSEREIKPVRKKKHEKIQVRKTQSVALIHTSSDGRSNLNTQSVSVKGLGSEVQMFD